MLNADATTFVGRIRSLRAPGPAVSSHRQLPLSPGEFQAERPSDVELRQMRQCADGDPLVITVVGDSSNGVIALIDLHADESVVATLDRAIG